MSDLDFEAETTHSDNQLQALEANETHMQSTIDQARNFSGTSASKSPVNDINFKRKDGENTEIVASQTLRNEDGEINSEDEKLSDIKANELEEGEIEESNVSSNTSICRYFKNGTCHYANNCRFIHVGVSAYKMFDLPNKSSSIKQKPPLYHPINRTPPCIVQDSWEQGLEEAKKLLQNARFKKDDDVEFEEKKLYLDVERGETGRFDTYSSSYRVKDDKTEKPIEKKLMNRNSKLKKTFSNSINFFSSKKMPSMSWLKKKSRKRSRSHSSSSLSSSRHSRESSCSVCSSVSDLRIRNHAAKLSKLDRVFSRTFPKSHKRSISKSLSPRLVSKSISRRSYSRSRSSSRSHHAKKYSSKNLTSETTTSIQSLPKVKSSNEKNIEIDCKSLSPLSDKYSNPKSGWESTSSSMTVSSITCTSLSDVTDQSSAESSSAKSIVDTRLCENRNIRSESTSPCKERSKHLKSQWVKHIAQIISRNDKEPSNSQNHSKLDKDTYKHCRNYSKPEKDSSNDSRNISETEKATAKDSLNNTKPTKLPSSQIFDSKQMSDSKNKDKPNASLKPEHFPTHSKQESRFENLEKSKAISKSDQPFLKKQNRQCVLEHQKSPEREITAAEQELLRYVQIKGTPCKSTFTKSVRANKSVSITTKPVTKIKKLSVSQNKLEETSNIESRPLTRRELLIEQLRAVELAIARKKNNT